MKYELVPQSKCRFSFIPGDLRYFNSHFVCQSMSDTWKLPPASAHGRNYKAADFVLWMLSAPVVSQPAKDVLSCMCRELVEFLPFHSIKGAPYFAINVLNQDTCQPIYKTGPHSVVYVDEHFGELIRDYKLSGVALADPMNEIGRRTVRGESLHDFPGLVG